MYCKKMLLPAKKCSTNQICRLSTARIHYTIKYLKDGLIIFTQKERKRTMQTNDRQIIELMNAIHTGKDSEEVVVRFGAKLI